MNKLNNKNKPLLNEIYQVDFDNFFNYPTNYPKYLPKRNDIKYTNIHMIEDYEFTNCIAFEMLIRTKEYKELMKVPNNEIDDKWKSKIQNLGLNPLKAISIKNTPYPIGLFKGLPFSSPIQQDTTIISIDDIDNGLELLIKFYIEKTEIFTVKEQKKHPIIANITINEYQIDKKPTLKKILKNLDKYYIPCIPNNLNFQQDKCQLNNDLYIINLEKRFIQTIENKIPKNKNIKFYPIFKRPQLRFEESRIAELDINLDLPKKELIAYIEKIKDEYDKNHSIARNVLDIVSTDNDETEKKPLKTIKNNIADAFFCYDYYKAKKDYIENKNKGIETLNDDNILLQEKKANLEILQNERLQYKTIRPNAEQMGNLNEKIKHLKEEIEKEIKKLKKVPSINKGSKNYVFKEKAFSKSKINPNTAYHYYTKLAPYIDNLQYKNLLIGNR